MRCSEIKEFLNHFSVEKRASASTQTQALNAWVCVYKKALKIPVNNSFLKHTPVGESIPVIFTYEEAQSIFSNLRGNITRWFQFYMVVDCDCRNVCNYV
jgi:hypothetical protein